MIDDKTSHLNLPLPHADNLLDEDVLRLREALSALDVEIDRQNADTSHALGVAETAAKTANWPQIAGKPATYPPAPHGHAFSELSGVPALRPALHKISHVTGGSDAISPADIGAAPVDHSHPAADIPVPFFPGFITSFYGSLDSTGKFPLVNNKALQSWHVCDGTGGTPDLRDRFVVGASESKYMGNVGGSAACDIYGSVTVNASSVNLSGTVGETTLTVAQMPLHAHKVPSFSTQNVVKAGSQGTQFGAVDGYNVMGRFDKDVSKEGEAKSHTHTLSGSSGNHIHTTNFNGNPVSTIPPYTALHYIMYLG